MIKFIITFVLIGNISLCFSQIHRNVYVKPFIDTTTTEFRSIFKLWEDYLDTLSLYSIKSNFAINETNSSINSFWIPDDITTDRFPDIIYSTVVGYGWAYYPLFKEYFLGFARRDPNIYEFKTMFVPQDTSVFHNTPNLIISVYIEKTGNNFRLLNKLSYLLQNQKISKQEFDNLTYYYSPLYLFNPEDAQKLNERIKIFKNGFDIKSKVMIDYFVAENISEIYNWFGIDYFSMDYNSTMSMIEGRALDNRMILSGGGGENFFHEIIHILLINIRNGEYGYFEEGIACFFGEHVGHSYQYHIARLKKYLKNNEWIDFSKDLTGYYKDSETKHSYNKTSEDDFRIYGDSISNFTYIIHSVLCDMAFRKGGYDLVKQMLMDKDDNIDEFYKTIEKYLGIKRKDVDKVIKEYVNSNY